MNTSLVLIDLQNDYFPGGAMELEGSIAAAEAAATLLQAFRLRHLPIIHIQHISARADATFFLPQTEGAKIHPMLAPRDDEMVISKHFPNAFRQTSLQSSLEALGITQLVVGGMMTHMCVDTTVRAACDLGFSCLLAHDACATKHLVFQGKTVAAAQVQTAYMAALEQFTQGIDSAAAIGRAILADTLPGGQGTKTVG